jgi:hypothetical protein
MTRSAVIEKILGSYRGQKVLVIGIGGGGDVVGTLPTCFELERLGATVIPAGITWKRVVHDPLALPRALSDFINLDQVNRCIGFSNPNTQTHDGIVHIEARLSRSMGGRAIGMIDVSFGIAALRECLKECCTQRGIDAIIGIDAGGDVLCMGNEPTIESPLIDQILLATLCGMDRSLLGVFGFGSDGEFPLSLLPRRFEELVQAGAYRGTIPIAWDDMPRMVELLKDAPTESSRLPVEVAQGLSPERLDQLLQMMNVSSPDLSEASGRERVIMMRSGTRQATLSDLTAVTMFFDPQKVFISSRFAGICNESFMLTELHEAFSGAGITTEYSGNERELVLERLRSNS